MLTPIKNRNFQPKNLKSNLKFNILRRDKLFQNGTLKRTTNLLPAYIMSDE